MRGSVVVSVVVLKPQYDAFSSSLRDPSGPSRASPDVRRSARSTAQRKALAEAVPKGRGEAPPAAGGSRPPGAQGRKGSPSRPHRRAAASEATRSQHGVAEPRSDRVGHKPLRARGLTLLSVGAYKNRRARLRETQKKRASIPPYVGSAGASQMRRQTPRRCRVVRRSTPTLSARQKMVVLNGGDGCYEGMADPGASPRLRPHPQEQKKREAQRAAAP